MPDLILDDGDMLPEDLQPEKRRMEEISRGRRKRRHEEDLRGDKQEYSPTESRRVHHPQGFYSEEWNDDQQEEDDYQSPYKFQRISNMVFSTEAQRFLRSNTKGTDVAYSTYMDMCVTP